MKDKLMLDIENILKNAISSDYIKTIVESTSLNGKSFIEEIVDDVIETSDYENGKYSNDDIKLAIGRVLLDRLNIEY